MCDLNYYRFEFLVCVRFFVEDVFVVVFFKIFNFISYVLLYYYFIDKLICLRLYSWEVMGLRIGS